MAPKTTPAPIANTPVPKLRMAAMVAAAALEEVLVALLPPAVPEPVGVGPALEVELTESTVMFEASNWPHWDCSVALQAA